MHVRGHASLGILEVGQISVRRAVDLPPPPLKNMPIHKATEPVIYRLLLLHGNL